MTSGTLPSTNGTPVVHAFRSATAIVAWCGAVDRPTAPRREFEADSPESANVCPDCVAACYGPTAPGARGLGTCDRCGTVCTNVTRVAGGWTYCEWCA